MDKEKILVIDTETTGFDNRAEILQVSVMNGRGDVVMNEYFRPRFTRSWPGAEAVNHISPSMVEGKESFFDSRHRLEALFQEAHLLVGYNLPFDLRMLRQNGAVIPRTVRCLDLMKPFAATYGELDRKYGGYKWQKLITCAGYYGYEGGGWHDSLADTKATLFCFWKMVEDGSVKI